MPLTLMTDPLARLPSFRFAGEEPACGGAEASMSADRWTDRSSVSSNQGPSWPLRSFSDVSRSLHWGPRRDDVLRIPAKFLRAASGPAALQFVRFVCVSHLPPPQTNSGLVLAGTQLSFFLTTVLIPESQGLFPYSRSFWNITGCSSSRCGLAVQLLLQLDLPPSFIPVGCSDF